MTAETLFLPPGAVLAPPAPPLPAAYPSTACEAWRARLAEWEAEFTDKESSEMRRRAVGAAARLFPATDAPTFRRWYAARLASSVTAEEEAEEPLLRPEEGRCVIHPLRDPEMWEYRKTIERLHWIAQEVDLGSDRADLEKVSAGDRRLLEHVLAFFSIADEAVMEGLDGRLSALIRPMEGQFYLRAQADQECIHSEAYALQIQELVGEPARRRELFAAVRTFPVVGRMADWVRWWTLGAHPAADLFAAMAFIEGALFSGFFATLQHYKTRNLFPGVTQLNEFICRDEGVHTGFWCYLVTEKLRRRPDPGTVRAIAAETVELVEVFFRTAVPEKVVGLSAPLLGQYGRHVTDSIVTALGYESVFPDENPFAFMDRLALNAVLKTNFFERRPTQYQSLGAPDALSFRVREDPLEIPALIPAAA